MVRTNETPVGVHYTPRPVAKQLTSIVLEPILATVKDLNDLTDLRILDPTCGAGVFLEVVLEMLQEHWCFLEQQGQHSTVKRSSLVGCLYGMDVDPIAVDRVKNRFQHAHIRCDDWLGPQIQDWSGVEFHAIVGNPPWVSFSGKHSTPIAPKRRAYLLQTFQTFAGWPCLQSPCVEKAVSVLSSSGRMGFVLPEPVCDLDGYAGLRQLLRSHGTVEEPVVVLGEDIFDDVTQRSIGLVFQKECRKHNQLSTGTPFQRTLRPCSDLFERLLPLLEACPRPPPGTFTDIGVHSGNMSKMLVVNQPKGDVIPVREGKDLVKGELRQPRKWIRLDIVPEKGQYYRIGNAKTQMGMPILIRQTAKSPHAALHSQPAAFRNSLLGCRGISGWPHEWTVAWLNSTIVAVFHHHVSQESRQKSFPQIKVRHLQNLPLPGNWKTIGHQQPSDMAISRLFGLTEQEHLILQSGHSK